MGERIIAVIDEFGFDDGDDAVILAFFGVFGKDLAAYGDGGRGGSEDFVGSAGAILSGGVVSLGGADIEGGAPFGET